MQGVTELDKRNFRYLIAGSLCFGAALTFSAITATAEGFDALIPFVLKWGLLAIGMFCWRIEVSTWRTLYLNTKEGKKK